MKHYKYIVLMVSLIFLFSCEKETEGISRITEYATFDMQGADFMFVTANSTFTDPGVTARQGETDLPVDIKGTVNTAVPDVYTIQYSATNSDGFPASVQRIVAVVAALPTADLSGNYQVVHATRTTKMVITKNNGILGYYRASNSWWQSSPIPLDFVDMGDGTIKVLRGSSPYGGHYGVGTISTTGDIKFTITMPDQNNLVYNTTWRPV